MDCGKKGWGGGGGVMRKGGGDCGERDVGRGMRASVGVTKVVRR